MPSKTKPVLVTLRNDEIARLEHLAIRHHSNLNEIVVNYITTINHLPFAEYWEQDHGGLSRITIKVPTEYIQSLSLKAKTREKNERNKRRLGVAGAIRYCIRTENHI